MSLMTRNDTSAAWNERAKQRALDTYAQLVPMAKNTYAQVVPMARQGADVVVAWANPRVRGARVWAAPRAWNRPASRCATRSGLRSRAR